MDAGLLTCADADGLPVRGVADGIRLGVFQRDQRNNEVADSGFRQVLVLRNDVGQQGAVDAEIVAALLEGDAEDLLALRFSGDVIGIDFNDVVFPVPFGFQDLKGLGLIARSDHAVGNLALDQLGRGDVADVRKGDPVAEGAHAVRAAGAGVGAGKGGCIQLRHVVNEAGPLQAVGKRQADCRRGRTDVLK